MPRRSSRGPSLGRARSEREVDDTGERGRGDAEERDEREDAGARRALNDRPDPVGDEGPDGHHRRREQRSAERRIAHAWVPDDRGGDSEEQTRQRPPAPAYRRRPARGEDKGRHYERHIRRREGEEDAQSEDEKRARVESTEQ